MYITLSALGVADYIDIISTHSLCYTHSRNGNCLTRHYQLILCMLAGVGYPMWFLKLIKFLHKTGYEILVILSVIGRLPNIVNRENRKGILNILTAKLLVLWNI